MIACSDKTEDTTKAESENAAFNEPDTDSDKDIVEEETKEEPDDNELSEGPLLEVGQWLHEDDGTKVTLTAIDSDERILDLDPIIMTIQDVKLMDREGGEFEGSFIQVSYEIENTSNEQIMFNGIDVITTDAKQQIEVSSEDVSGDYIPNQYHGEIKQDGFILVPYKEDIKSIKLITSDVWDGEKPDKFHDSVTEEISFD